MKTINPTALFPSFIAAPSATPSTAIKGSGKSMISSVNGLGEVESTYGAGNQTNRITEIQQ